MQQLSFKLSFKQAPLAAVSLKIILTEKKWNNISRPSKHKIAGHIRGWGCLTPPQPNSRLISFDFK